MANLKKTLVCGLLAAAFLVPCALKAEDKWQGTASFDVINIDTHGNTPAFGFELGAWRRVHEYMQAGFGAGLTESWKFKGSPVFPVFAGLHAEQFDKGFTPTFDFRAGYRFNTNNFDYSGMFINPMIGIRLNRIGFQFGYMGGIANIEGARWESSFNLRFTYYFGYHSTKMSRALTKGNFGIEVFGGPSISATKYNQKAVSTYGLNLSLLYPVMENLEMGPMVGIQVLSLKQRDTFSGEKWYDGSEQDACFPIALRTKYRARQISIAGRLYPWAQLDLGAAITPSDFITSSFYWSPAVGVSLDVRDGKSSVDLGIGYSTNNVYTGTSYYVSPEENDTFSSGSLRISLGYTF